jgi:hypothetical protein
MLKQIDDEKIIPFRYVLADSVYGTKPEFIDTVENMVTERMAPLLHEPRVKSKVIHRMLPMLRRRVYGLALGYEDIHDHSTLRSDPADPDRCGTG